MASGSCLHCFNELLVLRENSSGSLTCFYLQLRVFESVHLVFCSKLSFWRFNYVFGTSSLQIFCKTYLDQACFQIKSCRKFSRRNLPISGSQQSLRIVCTKNLWQGQAANQRATFLCVDQRSNIAMYTFCYSLPENILSLTPTSNS